MVQGEINTVVSPSIPSNNPGKYYDSTNNNILNLNNNETNGEKKKKVGNYIISKTIGEGSFAKVRLGYHLITQQMVYYFILKNIYEISKFEFVYTFYPTY
jgi:hypothetical protein